MLRRCSGLVLTQSEQVQGQRFGGNLLDLARRAGFGQDQAVGVFADLFEIGRPQWAGPFDFYRMETLPVHTVRNDWNRQSGLVPIYWRP